MIILPAPPSPPTRAGAVAYADLCRLVVAGDEGPGAGLSWFEAASPAVAVAPPSVCSLAQSPHFSGPPRMNTAWFGADAQPRNVSPMVILCTASFPIAMTPSDLSLFTCAPLSSWAFYSSALPGPIRAPFTTSTRQAAFDAANSGFPEGSRPSTSCAGTL